MPGTTLTKDEMREIKKLIGEGKSIRVAAQLIGRHEKTIYRNMEKIRNA